MNPKVAFVTLGCKLNFSETSTLAKQFAANGYSYVKPSEEADVYVVNTCSVTEHADKKCRNIIRKLHKISPEALIAVTGCYAQLKPQEILEIDGVDVVLGAQQKGDLLKIVSEIRQSSNRSKHSYSCEINKVESIFPAYSSGERTRSFLKIQDGCDYHCTYCTVPLARGKSRNIPIDKIISQAREIASDGVREIVLTGVNTGDFGKTTGESFADLLKQLNEVDGIERYRISSIEPNLLTEDIVEWIASGTKFLPHFHIPIQSGCDRILAAMHRRYNTSMFEAKISMIRDKMELSSERNTSVFLGFDVIVGFPGESDEDFEQTYSLLERIKPAFLHIFPYSRRSNTPAAALPDQVRDSVKSEREERLNQLCIRLHNDFIKANTGRRAKVLFESTQKGGMMFGYTENYIKVERPYDKFLIGNVVEVTL
ncbi:MAG: tRNA (N(6)-L-threonylcarbamoyladenosine(37)-C(2))-methylthiotransferase MtaB [Bacteroidales bacterium]|nr:tRNA (N(6)-L-threonylcarbamoyladenosine(37)-C(2))-methylthiotransferase MtaB [Bacteroidales bacterium]MDD4670133.1 tRNA (N(6)-L-threonylcarbamoyladenosine(37)-C(2))-methylthiotransferase MtaB [Bacteroidales bacterium]